MVAAPTAVVLAQTRNDVGEPLWRCTGGRRVKHTGPHRTTLLGVVGDGDGTAAATATGAALAAVAEEAEDTASSTETEATDTGGKVAGSGTGLAGSAADDDVVGAPVVEDSAALAAG